MGFELRTKRRMNLRERLMQSDLSLHPLCVFFPRIVGNEFDSLVADIRANGLREPITLYEGQVLDGGNRYSACLEAGIEPHFVGFTGGDIAAFVLSANMHRRHLSQGQNAAIIAQVTNWAEANQRGGKRVSDESATLPLATVADRAKASGTSERTQRKADAIAKADPALAAEVAQGTTTLAKAVEKIAEAKPKSERQTEAEQADTEAWGEIDPIKELEDAQAEIAVLQSKLDAVESDSPQGIILSLKRQLAAADNSRDEAKRIGDEHKKIAKRYETQLKRIGRLVGETDVEKVADAVEKALKAA